MQLAENLWLKWKKYQCKDFSSGMVEWHILASFTVQVSEGETDVSANNSEWFSEPCMFKPVVANVLDAISESGHQNTLA